MCADWVNEGDIDYLSHKVLYVHSGSLWFRSELRKTSSTAYWGKRPTGFYFFNMYFYMYHFILSSGWRILDVNEYTFCISMHTAYVVKDKKAQGNWPFCS